MAKRASFYSTLTPEEMTRVEPCKKTKCIIVSGDSLPTLQSSVPLVKADLPDNGSVDKIDSGIIPLTTKLLLAEDQNGHGANSVENSVEVTRAVLPTPEPQPKIEKNGLELESREPTDKRDDDACLIDCIYFMQQCCECVIL